MGRVVYPLLGLVCAGLVAACGSAAPQTHERHDTAASCTDTWTGDGYDSDYADPLNWSIGSEPSGGDNVCIPPGSFVVVTSTPPQRAASLVNEGSMCLEVSPQELAWQITNGVAAGQRQMASLRNVSSKTVSSCPRGTILTLQGTTTPHLNRSNRSTHSRKSGASRPNRERTPTSPSQAPWVPIA